MATRMHYNHKHLDSKRRQEGALERLRAQLELLSKKDPKVLYRHKDFDTATKYVKTQIAKLEERIR